MGQNAPKASKSGEFFRAISRLRACDMSRREKRRQHLPSPIFRTIELTTVLLDCEAVSGGAED
jgi:hypothetical protein